MWNGYYVDMPYKERKLKTEKMKEYVMQYNPDTYRGNILNSGLIARYVRFKFDIRPCGPGKFSAIRYNKPTYEPNLTTPFNRKQINRITSDQYFEIDIREYQRLIKSEWDKLLIEKFKLKAEQIRLLPLDLMLYSPDILKKCVIYVDYTRNSELEAARRITRTEQPWVRTGPCTISPMGGDSYFVTTMVTRELLRSYMYEDEGTGADFLRIMENAWILLPADILEYNINHSVPYFGDVIGTPQELVEFWSIVSGKEYPPASNTIECPDRPGDPTQEELFSDDMEFCEEYQYEMDRFFKLYGDEYEKELREYNQKYNQLHNPEK